MLRVLCAEPFLFRPWEVGRLTPFQVREILLVERSKDGSVILDPPATSGDEPELTMAGEFRTLWKRRGVTDPDALALLIERSLEDDAAGLAAAAARAEEEGSGDDDTGDDD